MAKPPENNGAVFEVGDRVRCGGWRDGQTNEPMEFEGVILRYVSETDDAHAWGHYLVKDDTGSLWPCYAKDMELLRGAR